MTFKNIRRYWWFGGVFLLGVAVAVSLPGLRPRDLMVRTMVQRIGWSDEATAAQLVARMVTVEDAGWRAAVGMLDDERPAVRAAAYEGLRLRIEAWKTREHGAASRRIADLAGRLRVQAAGFRPQGTLLAGELANQLLRWRFDPEAAVDPVAVIADCEVVVRMAAAVSSDQLRLARSLELRDLRPIQIPNSSAADPEPLEPEPEPEVDDSPASESSTRPSIDYFPRDEPTPPSADAGDSEPDVNYRAAAAGVVSREFPWPDLTHWEVIQALNDRDALHVLRAIEELKRRGFSDREVEVAERMVDPDVRIRRHLIDQITRLDGIESRMWLLLMLNDEDRQIRERAISLLGQIADTDADVRIALRRHAMTEPDPAIRIQLQRTLRR